MIRFAILWEKDGKQEGKVEETKNRAIGWIKVLLTNNLYDRNSMIVIHPLEMKEPSQ